MYEHIPDVMSVEQVASILKVGKRSVYNAISNKELRAKKIGKRFIVPKHCLLDYLSGDETCRQQQT